jgi:hypothetical protein
MPVGFDTMGIADNARFAAGKERRREVHDDWDRRQSGAT